jgi:holo-[acyl-carrier protein] synthase
MTPIKPPPLHEGDAIAGAGLRVGIDLVAVERIRESLATFGERFVRRLFSEGEAAYALQDAGVAAERLAARFAAKEAAIKAFGWSEASINWRDIEVVRAPGGACRLQLHGRAAELARAAGAPQPALSLTHEGGYAAAIVATLVS